MPRLVYQQERFLHPEATTPCRTDHHDADNRDQLRCASEYVSFWKRAVEGLAAELQVEPLEAHFLLMEASESVTSGLAWALWED